MKYLLIVLIGFAFYLNADGKGQLERPNIVFILVDDLGWTDLSCYGSSYYHTPNIDALAAMGVRFTQAYSACTVCSPTRASILTGKYPARLHCTDYIPGKTPPEARLKVPDWTMYLDTAEITLAEVCKANGYVTAHIGKWHLGKDECYWPENQGFDSNIGGWAKGAPIRNKKLGYKGYFAPYGNPRLSAETQGEYLTERLADEACRFIEQHISEPFFLNYWLYGVHLPLQASAEKIEKYKAFAQADQKQHNATYAAMIEHVDEAVGRVIKTLEKYGLLQKTIIVMTSDNGGLIGNAAHHKEKITSNVPLRSGKGDMYEGGVRVPCIIAFDGVIRPAVSDVPICSPDFFPTLVEMANLQNVNLDSLDGASLHSTLNGSDSLMSRPLYWHYPHYHSEGSVPHSAIRLGDYKLIHNIETNQYFLYNLREDISETQNLIFREPQRFKHLKMMLEQWRQSVNAQMPTVNE